MSRIQTVCYVAFGTLGLTGLLIVLNLAIVAFAGR